MRMRKLNIYESYAIYGLETIWNVMGFVGVLPFAILGYLISLIYNDGGRV